MLEKVPTLKGKYGATLYMLELVWSPHSWLGPPHPADGNGTVRPVRSRAGSVSFPDRTDMSPGLATDHNQLSKSGNYVELFFPPEVNMKGSQPNLAGGPGEKVGSDGVPRPEITDQVCTKQFFILARINFSSFASIAQHWWQKMIK